MTEFKSLEKDNLVIHLGKTKFLTDDKNISEAAKELNVEAVQSFKYLGVEINLNKQDTINAAVKRCRKYNNASMTKIKNLECSRDEKPSSKSVS